MTYCGKKYCVYKYTSPSGKAYIGQTHNLKKREIAHRAGSKGCTAFSNAIKKYGLEAFTLEILAQSLTRHEANVLEEEYIKAHNTISPEGYNLKAGGNNREYSEESKRRMSTSQRRVRADNPVRLASLETRRRRSEALKGHSVSENTKKLIGDANRGRKRSEETKLKVSAAVKGRKHSQKTKQKIGAAQTGEKNHMYGVVGSANPTAKKFVITFPDGREEIIHGLVEFCRSNGLTQSNMSSVATGRLPHHKGFKCKYYEKEVTNERF